MIMQTHGSAWLSLIAAIPLMGGCSAATDDDTQAASPQATGAPTATATPIPPAPTAGATADPTASLSPPTPTYAPTPTAPATPTTATATPTRAAATPTPGGPSPTPTPGTPTPPPGPSWVLTDTYQDQCYDAEGNQTLCPTEGQANFGQDAQYDGIQPSVTTAAETATDHTTGLMWQKTPEEVRYTFSEAQAYCEVLDAGGHTDWRLPNIKELVSITDFRGSLSGTVNDAVPYINDDYFDIFYPEGQEYAGQYWSTNLYLVGPVAHGEQAAFGMNHTDGHLKAYSSGWTFENPSETRPSNGLYIRCVRGGDGLYGTNDFRDNGDGTVTDAATGLTWQQQDSASSVDWPGALAYCENLNLADKSDWRLPNAKELQGIVDYAATQIPAINGVFSTTDADSWFWTSTTHGDNTQYAVYIAFGKAYSRGPDQEDFVDWHGAGALRSDPKAGDPDDFQLASENAEDLVRINNYARCVRGGGVLNGNPGGEGDDGGSGPPQEAIDACDGKGEDDACSFNGGMGTVQGSCANIGGTLACAPSGGPPM